VHIPRHLARTIARQEGIVSREQLAAAGITRSALRHAVATDRWRVVHPRVYCTHRGPLGERARCWAAVLHAGHGACVSDETAAWIHRWREVPPAVHVVVARQQRVRAPGGVVVHRRDLEPDDVTTVNGLPVTRPMRTLLDLMGRAGTADEAFAVLGKAVQSRSVSPSLLADRIASMPRLRRRRVLLTSLTHVADGSHSPLELAFVRTLQRHGVRLGRRQAAVGPMRVDMLYDDDDVAVELDGKQYHDSADGRFRDRRRDNAHAVQRRFTLRYGWRDVVGDPCAVAREVAGLTGQVVRECRDCRT
jgi:very-short-patch-repair endonuclease/predicted transcriptional regulator of viral defense system